MTEEADTASPTPEVKSGDWIQLLHGKWAQVDSVHTPTEIECAVVDNRGDAYHRRFEFRNGWWRFANPSPDGGYFDSRTRKRRAEELREGPPYRIVPGTIQVGPVNHTIEYLPRSGQVWLPPRGLSADED